MTSSYFLGVPVHGDLVDAQVVVQIAGALATVFERQPHHPLAASRAVTVAAEAFNFDLRLPPSLADRRAVGIQRHPPCELTTLRPGVAPAVAAHR